MSRGIIVWRGTSLLDRRTPIAVVLTGLSQGRSRNSKTGDMVQAWILVDDGRGVIDSLRDGTDAAICGECRHRGDRGKGRTCYVALHTGLGVVSRNLRSGRYPDFEIRAAAALLDGGALRIGAYGDPAAVPVSVWRTLTARCRTWTGYTHQWKRRPALRRFAMASVDTPQERAQAQARGWRTFRVRAVGEGLETGEVVCPAAIEAGKRTTCARCSLCRGDKQAKDVAIIDHSTKALWARGLGPRKRLQVIQ